MTITTTDSPVSAPVVVPQWQRRQFVDRLASRIRDIYIAEVDRWNSRQGRRSRYRPGPKWDGGRDSGGRHHKAVWPKIAEFVLNRELDEARFIRAQFEKAAYQPQPNQLTNERAVGQYLDSVRQLPGELERALLIQGRSAVVAFETLRATSQWHDNLVWAYVLSDLRNELTALFRFCVAASVGLPHVQLLFHDAALAEYLRHRVVYDRIWGEHIPESLRVEAAAILVV